MKNFNIQFIFDKIRINYLLKKIEVNSYNISYKLLSSKLNFLFKEKTPVEESKLEKSL